MAYISYMLVYLDESYAKKEKLLIGALFFPSHNGRIWIHNAMLGIKSSYGLCYEDGKTFEVKYSKITTKRRLEVAKKIIDLFFECQDSYFRAGIIPYDEEQLNKMGRQRGIPLKIKEAMLYTKITMQLFQNNIPDVRGADLLMDNLTRARKDKFDNLILQRLGSGENAMFKHIGYVDSSETRNQLIQICDLLLGAILNEHYPTISPYKNEFREHVKSNLGVESLNETYWGKLTQKECEKRHPKYTARFWKVPYQFLN